MMPEVALKIAEVILRSFTLTKEDEEACRRYFDHVFSDPLVTPEGIL